MKDIHKLLSVMGGGFSPDSISWLARYESDSSVYTDAEKTTLAINDGDVVYAWADKSGNGLDLTQATADNRPLYKLNILNGRPAIRTDGSNDWLSSSFGATYSQPLTYIKVTVPRGSIANSDIIIDGYDATHRQAIYQGTTGRSSFYAGTSVIALENRDGLDVGQITVTVFNGASSNHKIYNTKAVTGNPGTHGANGLWVGSEYSGAARHVSVDYLAIYIYNGTLTDAQINNMLAYLQTKYSLNYPTKSTLNPIVTLGAGGAWDDVDVANPDIFYDTPNSRWVMNYSGYSGSEWGTGLAYSTNLLTWTKEATNPILTPSVPDGEGTYIAANGSIVLFSGTYYLYYQVSSTKIFCATSSDLLTWARQGVVIDKGGVGEWDEGGTFDPRARVMDDGITIEVFYAGMNAAQTVRKIGRATSTDGTSFTKIGALFDADGSVDSNFGEPDAIGSTGASYEIWTDWSAVNGYRKIARWKTTDSGATWKFAGIVLDSSDSGWDSVQAFDVCTVLNGGYLYIYYAGADAAGGSDTLNAQIGVASMRWP